MRQHRLVEREGRARRPGRVDGAAGGSARRRRRSRARDRRRPGRPARPERRTRRRGAPRGARWRRLPGAGARRRRRDGEAARAGPPRTAAPTSCHRRDRAAPATTAASAPGRMLRHRVPPPPARGHATASAAGPVLGRGGAAIWISRPVLRVRRRSARRGVSARGRSSRTWAAGRASSRCATVDPSTRR